MHDVMVGERKEDLFVTVIVVQYLYRKEKGRTSQSSRVNNKRNKVQQAHEHVMCRTCMN